jgi:hypothetical protein
LRTLSYCLDAEYVAFCDGDDKWTSADKLAHQVAFLDQNRQYLAMAHNVTKHYTDDGREELFGSREDAVLSMDDLFLEWPFHIVSLVVRSDALRGIFDAALPRVISLDRFFNTWIGCHGDLFYEGSKVMAVYNIHNRGASGTMDRLRWCYEELDMIRFFTRFEHARRLCRIARARTIESIAWYWGNRGGEKKHSGPALAADYARLTLLRQRSNWYYFLLLLFGRVFYRLHSRLRALVESWCGGSG